MIDRKKFEELRGMTAVQREAHISELQEDFTEQQILRIINNDALDLFVAGAAGCRFPDADGLSFTNAGTVLNSIYRVYKKYPELNVDDLLNQALIKLLNGPEGYFYTALNTIYTQLWSEENGTSPFEINDQRVFITLKENIKRNLHYLKTADDYRGALYKNKLYGFVEDINGRIKKQKGIEVL